MHTQALEDCVLGFVFCYRIYAVPKGNVALPVSASSWLAWVEQYRAANPLDSLTSTGATLAI